MSEALWRYSLRQTQRRMARSLLTLHGISIGVATVVAVSIAVDTMRSAYDEMFDAISGQAAIEVTAAAQVPFDSSLASKLIDLNSVDAAVGVIQKPAAFLQKTGPIPILILGVDPETDTAVRSYDLLRGDFLDKANGVLIGTDFARSHDLDVGSKLRCATTMGILQFNVAGILKSDGAARYNGGQILIAPISDVQQKFKMGSRVNALHVVVQSSRPVKKALIDIDQVLPAGFTAQAGNQSAQIARDTVLNLEQILSVLGVVSLVTGGFVILNTFQINLGERRQQLAILRAIGATPWQIGRALLREAVVYGVLGTFFGTVLGVMIAAGLLPGVEGALGTGVSGLHLTIKPFLLAIAMGPGMTLAAVYVPSRQAAKRDLLADLLQKPLQNTATGTPFLPVLIGFALIGCCLTITTSFTLEWIPAQLGSALLPLACMSAIVGCVLILPMMLPTLFRPIEWLLGRVFGTEGQVAWRQVTRDGGRTTLTCGVLVVAMIIAVGPGNEITSGMKNIYRWLERVVSADFIVDAIPPDAGLITAVEIPESVGQELAKINEIQRIDQANWFPIQVEGATAVMIAATYSSEHPERLNASRDTPSNVIERLIAGDAVLGTVLAKRLGLVIGDELQITTTKRTERFRIAGLSSQYHAGGMTVHLHRDVAKELFEFEGVNLVSIYAERGSVANVGKRLSQYCDQEGLRLQSFEQMKESFEQRVSGTINFLWILMALVFLVAALGIVNTLTINVLEQTRQLGILRAIGMTRSQVGKTILAQGLGMVLVSLPPGLFFGICLAVLMNLAQEPMTGHHIPFELHTFLLVGTVAAAILTTLAATWIPAQRAARTEIVQAIQYE